MSGKRNHTSFIKVGSAIFMILALLWLTISTPFVFAASQVNIDKHDKMTNASSPLDANDEESANPLGNATEEKTPNTSFSEEYLHDHHKTDNLLSSNLQYHHSHNADTYIAFHGELHVPPPDPA